MLKKLSLWVGGRSLLAWLVLLFIAQTTPAPAASSDAARWKFVFFSDTQDPLWGQWLNTNMISELAVAIKDEQPEFVLFGGDMANHPQAAVPPLWQSLMQPVYDAGIPVYATVGNHDKWGAADFAKAFGPAHPDNGPVDEVDLTFALQHRNALVLGLNAFNPTNEYRVNQAWVDAVLATNTQPHVFAFTHPAAFKLLHGDCLGTYPTERDALWRSLLRVGSRMFFTGHDHFYDHAHIDDGDGNPNNDIHQFIVGTGGAAFYDDSAYDGANGVWTPKRIYHAANFGYIVVEIEGSNVTANWKQRTAPSTYAPSPDVFTYSLPGGPPTLHAKASGDGALTLTWEGSAMLQASSDFTSGFTNVPSATSPYKVTDMEHQQLFFRLVAE